MLGDFVFDLFGDSTDAVFTGIASVLGTTYVIKKVEKSPKTQAKLASMKAKAAEQVASAKAGVGGAASTAVNVVRPTHKEPTLDEIAKSIGIEPELLKKHLQEFAESED